MTGHTLGPAATRTALADLRPELLERYDAALSPARAGVLARLWGALGREPLPGVTRRQRCGDVLTVTVGGGGGGRTVTGPAGAAEPFAQAPAGLRLHLGPQGYDDPAVLLAALALPGRTGRLGEEMDNSVANLALAYAVQDGGGPVLDRLAALPPAQAAAEAEAFVVDGHPLHPCCRTRAGMSVGEVLAYAPEHRPSVPVLRYRVPAARWYGTAPPLLPVHPWQAAHVLDAYPWLRPDGTYGPARPLMSLRTLAPVDGGDHLKTAVDVQLTSAVRTVSAAAVHNGPRMSALLAGLTADLPTFTVLAETAAGAALVDGQPVRSLAYLRRQAPRPAPGDVVVPVAAIPARPALLREVVAGYGGDPGRWLTALAATLVPPLLTLLHRGVALEAHGQNTLLVLRRGRCAGVLYRDFGGVRVSAARLRAAGVEPPPLHGDLPTDDPQQLRTKLAAAVFGTVAAQQVAALCTTYGVPPQPLWAIWARAVRAAGTPDGAALLRDPLPVKATTAMRLADDPLRDVWAWLDNPMAAQA